MCQLFCCCVTTVLLLCGGCHTSWVACQMRLGHFVRHCVLLLGVAFVSWRDYYFSELSVLFDRFWQNGEVILRTNTKEVMFEQKKCQNGLLRSGAGKDPPLLAQPGATTILLKKSSSFAWHFREHFLNLPVDSERCADECRKACLNAECGQLCRR